MTIFIAMVDDDHVNDLVIHGILDDKVYDTYVIPIKKE